MDRRSYGWRWPPRPPSRPALRGRAARRGAAPPVARREPASRRHPARSPRRSRSAVGAYTEFRSARFAGWHPTSREALILTRFADTNQLHEVRMPLGARRQLTFFPDRVADASWPRHSARLLACSPRTAVATSSADFPHRRRDRRTTWSATAAARRIQLGPVVEPGRPLAFASTRRNGVDRDIYVIDPRDPSSTRRVARTQGRRLGAARLVAGRLQAGGRSSTCRSTKATCGWWTWRAASGRAADAEGRRQCRSPTTARSSVATARVCTSRPTATPSSCASPTSISRPARTAT